MPKDANATNVLYWLNHAIDQSPEMYLHNVVINCHGTPGFLHVGGSWSGFGDAGTTIFRPLRSRGSIGRIILVACQIAADGDEDLGKKFCSNFAKEAGVFVVGADALQSVDTEFETKSHPYGSIDDFEGTPFEFSPGGSWGVWTPE